MVNYYGKFVPHISQLLKPLYEAARREEFSWTSKEEEVFQQVKAEITSERCLVHFNPDLPIKLVCDASKDGVGAVLFHVFPNGLEKPITFASRVLRNSEKNYSVIHKEALAIHWGVTKFYQYLVGRKFFLCSDHKPLLALFSENKGIPQMAAGKLQRWALFLSSFDYQFQYLKGKDNGAADGLSRLPRQVTSPIDESEDYFNFLVEEKLPVSAKEVRIHLRRDPVLSKILTYVRDGWPNDVESELKAFSTRAHELAIDNDLLMWGYRLIIPSSLRPRLLKEIHSGHIGIVKMKSLARQYFWWPKLDAEIEDFGKRCRSCQSLSRSPEKAELIKFREAEFPFDRVHIDFLGPFHSKIFLLLIDAYSRWPEVIEMKHTDSEATIEVLREIFARFGIPNVMISDNGRQLVSEEFEKFCKLNGILHKTSAPYHPVTNGLAENAVGSFKLGISKALHNQEVSSRNLKVSVSRYLFAYRNTPHCTTGESPAKRFFGRELRNRLDLLRSKRTDLANENQIKFFKGHRDISFSKGENVFVRNYKNPMKPSWSSAQIKEVLGDRTYLCNPENSDSSIVW
ncbi:uncharacterized protein K02A2.6-like [Leptopilina boulardi]|uniref:uncharacterized protein K02A2.6-like n=1 Tax=Leptopilina boulardi TaxID=63433 RepID=UPI0021F576D8|nr:uncharacterized protein K02A2.6-like [Leptopilina boulardi]